MLGLDRGHGLPLRLGPAAARVGPTWFDQHAFGVGVEQVFNYEEDRA